MRATKPTPVGVVTTVYNGEATVQRAIDSILCQSFADFEYVIVDDGSTDGTLDILNRLTDSRISIYTPGRLGRERALNYAIKHVCGKYIAILDADDLALPTRLEKQYSFLESNPQVGVLGTAYFREDDIRGERVIRKYPTTDPEIRREAAKYIPFCNSSVMMHSAIFEKVGGYRADYPGHEDYDLWLRVAKHYKFANLSEPLVVHKVYRRSYWRRNFSELQHNLTMTRLNIRAIRVLSLPKWYYVYPFMRLVYPFVPHRLKRLARRILSQMDEKEKWNSRVVYGKSRSS